MESMYDVIFSFGETVVFRVDGVASLANAISVVEAIHIKYETAIIYGYDQKGLRYVIHKREKHLEIVA